jgi:hypothetical protein
MEKKTFESGSGKPLHCNMYCFEPGQQNSLHRYPVSDAVVFCLEGEGIRWDRDAIHQGWRDRVSPDEHSPWVHQHKPGPSDDHERGAMSILGRTCAGGIR